MRYFAPLLIAILLSGGCSSRPQDVPAPATEAQSAQSCTFCPEQSPKDCTLCLLSNPLLNANKDGAASAPFRLCNRGTQPITLDLNLADFHASDRHGKLYPLAAVRAISPVIPGSPIFAGTSPLAATTCLDLKVDVSGLWQAGLSTAQLTNGAETVAWFKVVRYQVPFNVKIDGPTPERADFEFTRGKRGQLRLRNDDDMAYRVIWRMELGDQTDTGEVFIPAHGTEPIAVERDKVDFGFLESGFLRSAERTGTLTLTFEPDPSFSVLPLPQKRYPVTARLSYFPDWLQRATNYVAVLLVLLAGILISLFVNHALPTQKKRVDIKQRLADLDGRLAGLGGAIDAQVLSLLRLEKKRFREELRELLPIFPQSSIELPKLETRIEWLERRIDLTSGVGKLLETMETGAADLAVSEADDIRRRCREVLDVVCKGAATPEEVAHAKEHLQRAEAIHDAADSEPPQDAIQPLVDRATKIVSTIPDPLPQGSAWESFADVVGSLKKHLTLHPPENRQQYVRRARHVHQAELIATYVELVESSANTDMRSRRLSRAPDLIAALSDGPDESLARARDVVRETDQNVTRADLLAEMATDGTIRVEIDPPTPLAFQMVTFRLRFQRPGLDAAIAQDKIACVWYVDGVAIAQREAGEQRCGHGPDGRHARGWLVGSYFINERFKWQDLPTRVWRRLRAIFGSHERTARTFTVEAKLPDLDKPIAPATVTLERVKDYVESRTVLAMASLAVTLLIVAIGLLAGAQEKLQTLDWLSGTLAVLVLGFGADTVKTLITRT